MRKIDAFELHLLRLIANAGGSYCPDENAADAGQRALDGLVKAKRLSIEANDGAPPRYHLTAQGRADAS